ncbi:MAG: murein transglycosylase domain-containing protein [Syntrophobacterales bacterium]|jgi:membrane-bound lytic murein transglycosylase C
MNKLMGMCLTAIFVFTVTAALGQKGEYDSSRKRQQEQWEAFTKEGDDLLLEAEQQWQQMLREQQEAWERMVAEINRIWLDSLTTTKKEWVDYSDQYATRSYVNFERGDMVLATMIKTSETRIAELGKERLKRQLAKILSSNNQAGRSILAGQIADNKGQTVTKQTLDRYLNREVFPRLQRDPQPLVGKDGVPRYKISVPLKLIPDHTLVRARPYIPEVSRQAQRFRLRPELVMAVIHTESYFDPLARSHVPAYGLMQLVPIYGAREAYKFVHGEDRVLPANYLYQPTNNIELGTAYLNLLIYKHFASEANPLKNLYLSVCGYNWGPTAIHRKIIRRYPTSNMSPEQLYQVLRQRTPQETRDYLQRVTQRMGMYQPLFEG